jgi:hypothetical protein
MWKQHEAIDGTYTFEDLLVAHEILDVKEANEIALNEYIEAKRDS